MTRDGPTEGALELAQIFFAARFRNPFLGKSTDRPILAEHSMALSPLHATTKKGVCI